MAPKPLTEFPSGTRVTIAAFDAGCKARSRLCSLGLIPGTEIEVNGSSPGPLRVRVRGSEMVLGHGMAERVLAYAATK